MSSKKLIYSSDARKAILKADPKLTYCIDDIPGVDAVEVVHGRWLESEGTVCSVCNKHFFTDGPWAVANYKANYCPNCGARIDGGVEDGC